MFLASTVCTFSAGTQVPGAWGSIERTVQPRNQRHRRGGGGLWWAPGAARTTGTRARAAAARPQKPASLPGPAAPRSPAGGPTPPPSAPPSSAPNQDVSPHLIARALNVQSALLVRPLLASPIRDSVNFAAVIRSCRIPEVSTEAATWLLSNLLADRYSLECLKKHFSFASESAWLDTSETP